MNINCNFLYCNHQVHSDFLITLYNSQCNFQDNDVKIMQKLKLLRDPKHYLSL
jgi:hypothetical protein